MRTAVCLATAVCALLLAAPVADASVITWEGAASPSGQTYMRPRGIAVSGNEVFVGDSGRVGTTDEAQTPPRILKFDPDGIYVGEWATGFQPGFMKTDTGGNLYVVDQQNEVVKKYAPNGTGPTASFGACPLPALGCTVRDVAVDPAGNVYVVRDSLQRVDEYSSSGTFVESWSIPGEPVAIAAAPGGDIFVSQREPGRIYKLSHLETPTPVVDVYSPESFAVDGTGAFYVADGHGVEKFDSSGTLLGTWQVFSPYAIALDSLGRIYVTSPAGKPFLASGGPVSRLDPRDEAPTVALTATPDAPFASQLVTFDASGTTPPRLGKITKYEWDLDGDGSYETDGGLSPVITRRFQQVTAEIVRVRVSGSNGLSATKSVTLQVGQPPTFTSAMPSLVTTGEPVYFDATGSDIDLSQIERYEWDLDGNGSFETDTGTSPKTQHSYSSPGTLTAAVRVTRSGGRVDTATAPVEVRLAPPPGELGVSINGGAFATNDPHVRLSLVWPRLAESALVSNDGGFGEAGSTQLFQVAPQVDWILPSAGADRLPKTVYARFRTGGQSAPGTYTDDIVLDEGAPAVTYATAAHRVLRVKGVDDNTGIRHIVVKRPNGKHPVKTKEIGSPRAQGQRRVNAKLSLPSWLNRAYVRVTDVAGNRSRWRRISFR